MNLFKPLQIAFTSILATSLLMFSLAFGSTSELVYENQLQNFTVTLYDTPCVLPSVKGLIIESYQKRFQAGKIIFEGQKFDLCWAFLKALNPDLTEAPSEVQIFLIDESGDMGQLPYRLFAPKDYV